MSIPDFEKVKIVKRHARVNSPLIKLFNERWAGRNMEDETYLKAAGRVQALSQELLDLIIAGLL
jgi:hypothetical protein